MNLFIIIISIAIVLIAIMYASLKNAEEVKEEKPKFEPRKITVLSSDVEPKRKKKKYYNKKKKAVVNPLISEKRPVGRPKKVTE